MGRFRGSKPARVEWGDETGGADVGCGEAGGRRKEGWNDEIPPVIPPVVRVDSVKRCTCVYI